MRENGTAADPNAVFERLSGLQVRARTAERSGTSSPLGSPSPLKRDMRSWLDDVLGFASGTSAAGTGRLYTKLLVPNAAAGSIIGKAGSNINDVQARSFARIQLSKSGEFYPGTAERTLLVTGRIGHIIAALSLVFAKLLREGVAPLTPRSRATAEARELEEEEAEAGGLPDLPPGNLAVKLLVPQPLCGIIIGKGGATVRAYSAETDTQIRVTQQEAPSAITLSHRIVTVNGSPDQVLKAIALLVLKQAEDPKCHMYGDLTPSYTAVAVPLLPPANRGVPPFSMGPYGISPPTVVGLQHMPYAYHVPPQGGAAQAAPAMYGAAHGPPTGMFAPSVDGRITTMSFPLPEDQASLLMGSNGVVDELQAAAGVRIRVERSGSGVGGEGSGSSRAGPRIAQVTVMGPPEGVHYANYYMSQRLASVAMQQQQYVANMTNNGTTYYYRPQQQHAAAYSRNSPMTNGSIGAAAEMRDGAAGQRPSPRSTMLQRNRSNGDGV